MKIIYAICISALLVFSGCPSFFEPPSSGNQAGEKGGFSLTINEPGGRTIMPSVVQDDFAAISLEFFAEGSDPKTAQPDVAATRTNANLGEPVLLYAGIWDLHVTAYLKDGEGSLNPAARGTLDRIRIAEGAIVGGSVELRPIIDSGTGRFSWNIGYPENVAVAFMTITPFGETGGTRHYFIGGEPAVGKNDYLSLSAGYYSVVFELLLNDLERRAVRREILHVYKNMESVFEFIFTERHFPVDPLGAILAAWNAYDSRWEFLDADITEAHFIIAGINGIDDNNIEDIIDWFDKMIVWPAANLEELKILVDIALVGLAGKDPRFGDAGRYANRASAEAAIHSLVKNGTVIESIEWDEYITAVVRFAGQRQAQITFDGEILPPLSGIRIAALPNKTYFLMGEIADFTGLQVKNIFGTLERPATNYILTLPPEITAIGGLFRRGTFPIIISANSDNSITTSFNITVSNRLVDTGLPVIHIETQNGLPIDSRETFRRMNFTITSNNPAHNVERMGFADEIRGRGNSSWYFPQKPYRIRFQEEISLFGLIPARNWVLLANWKDHTLLTNAIAFELGHRFGVPFTPHAIHVDVVLNGEYQGTYVLTEHMRFGDGRVDIDRNNGWLVELDARFDEEPKFRTQGSLNLPVEIHWPDFGSDAGHPGYNSVRNDLNELDNILSAPNFPNNNYTDIIDIYNFIDYLLINEIVLNWEIAHPLSVFMHRDANEKIRLGPLWDFDYAFGLLGHASIDPSNSEQHFRKSTLLYRQWLFELFYNDPVFLEKHRIRWNEKLPDLLSISAFIDGMRNKLRASFLLHNRRWHGGVVSYEYEIAKLKEWWNRRIAFLDREINNPPASPDQLAGRLVILQAYASGNDASGATHSFVEIYNTTNSPINLNGISLFFAEGSTVSVAPNPAAHDGPWSRIPLSGTIPARGSFLVLGPRQNSTARLQIPDNSGDINSPHLILNNRAFKVALIRNPTWLFIQNPFNVDGNGTVFPGFIDMVGAANEYSSDGSSRDRIFGFETAPARNSASESVRRRNLVDTNNNSVDFISLNLAPDGISDALLSVRSPRNTMAGPWNPFQLPPPPPPPYPPVPSGNTLLIFQLGAPNASGSVSHSFIELFNAGDAPRDLAGHSLQIAAASASQGAADGPWSMIPLSGIIPPGHSFLVRGNLLNPAAPQQIREGDIQANFALHNRGAKVVLLSNQIPLQDVLLNPRHDNPFNIDGDGTRVPGYIDMVGAVNEVNVDWVNGFENAVGRRLTGSQALRRNSLIDHDNNHHDFESVDYRIGALTPERREMVSPNRLADGAWDPFAEPLPPSPPPETERLMILQANTFGNDNGGGGGFPRSLVELYNNTNYAIDLTAGNYYLHIGNLTAWTNVIKLEGVIPANSSFLIVSNTMPEAAGTNFNPTPRALLPAADQEADFVLNNGFKVAVLRNQSGFLAVPNPFTEASLIDDYVDMLGAGGAALNGYEGVRAGQSRPQGPRRVNLIDTDNNSVDFAQADFRGQWTGSNGMPNSELFRFWPRNSAAPWNPVTGLPAVHPVVRHPVTGEIEQY